MAPSTASAFSHHHHQTVHLFYKDLIQNQLTDVNMHNVF